MPSTELMRLAPTLSAEERFKLIIADFHKGVAGEQPVLSETERRAVQKCEGRAMWEEYTKHIGIVQWAGMFWSKDIETEKLRVLACHLMVSLECEPVVAELRGYRRDHLPHGSGEAA